MDRVLGALGAAACGYGLAAGLIAGRFTFRSSVTTWEATPLWFAVDVALLVAGCLVGLATATWGWPADASTDDAATDGD